eukprot:222988_1
MGKYSKDKRDIYYRKAKELGFRARSAFKLLQIDEEFNIFSDVRRAVDLCAAPGSWSQVLSRKLYENCGTESEKEQIKIVSVDLQPMAPIKGVIEIEGDITSVKTAQTIIDQFDGLKADLVVCDGAPDVTGMHDIDEYIQSQLILSALNITTYLLRKNGTFVCKIFRGRDINVLYQRLEIFFNNLSVAKPKSSRNSSIEAFIVCEGYNPPHDYVATMNILPFHESSISSTTATEFNHKKTIRFVACGDLSAYDADANYPLIEEKDKKDGKKKGYDYLEPVQPPTNPSYKEFLSLKQNQVFGNNARLVPDYDDQDNMSDLDQDNIIRSLETQEKKTKTESKYDDPDNDNNILEYHDLDHPYDTVDSLSVTTIPSPTKHNSRAKRAKSNRNRNRNQIAFYGSLLTAGVVVFYLAKFYYQTHQSNDKGSPPPTDSNNPSIGLRKK